jgi:hypothetical protein
MGDPSLHTLSTQWSVDCDIWIPVPANGFPKYICDAPAADEALSIANPLTPLDAAVLPDETLVDASTPAGNVKGEAVGSEKLITHAEPLLQPDPVPLFFTPTKR